MENSRMAKKNGSTITQEKIIMEPRLNRLFSYSQSAKKPFALKLNFDEELTA